jgi:hypothetical protein
MRTEKIIGLLALVGVILKILHVPGAGLLVTGSLILLSVLYFPAAFYFFSDKQIKRQNLAMSIIAGIFLSLISTGILFKIQHWEGAHLYLSVGLAAIIMLLIITYILKAKAADDLRIYYQNLVARLVISGVVNVVFYLLPVEILLNH